MLNYEMPEVTNPKAQWYILQCKGGQETTVCRNLKTRCGDSILEVWFPTTTATIYTRVSRREQKSAVATIPGYIYAKMVLTISLMNEINMTKYARFLKYNQHALTGSRHAKRNEEIPRPISDAEIARMKAQSATTALTPKVRHKLAVGTKVMIVDGSAFNGFIGHITKSDEEKKICDVAVSVLGRQQPIKNLSFAGVQPQ